MDCMAAKALKSSLLSDIAGQQGGFVDDMWCVTGLMNNVPCDDFSVDDLLDFSDKDFKEDYGEYEEKASTLSLSTSHHHHRNSNFSSFSETDDDFGSLFASELAAVPADELENLEWLSQFVDDSGSESSLLCPAGSFKDNKNKDSFSDKWSEPAVQVIRVPCFPFPLPVPVKPRSKRSRPNGKVWSGSTSLTSTESSSTSSSSSYGSSPFVLSNPVQDIEMLSSIEKPPAKKQKKKPATDTGLGTSRRCSHCQVQKTPQWRTGPLGSKTLCNACGVRFKSGRLFPEYRPACSPTFSQDVHSNSHRKVLEMRTKKDMSGHVEAGLSQMSPSF